MQRYYSDNNTFATATIATAPATDVLASATSPQGYYTLSFVPTTQLANSYTIRAAPQGVQTADTKCQTLTLTSTNVRGISGGTEADVTRCW